jgi:hypothetical protein
MKQLILVFIILQGCYPINGQNFGYEVMLEPIHVPGIRGLQSFAYGTQGDEWLIVGGRLDGLHRRQPFASFNPLGNNDQIMVVNPLSQKIWTKKLDALSADLREQLASTNMQFYQWGEKLVLTGGYAFSNVKEDFITFPFLTVINLPKLIEAVKKDLDVAECFYQIRDEKFSVAGGRLEMIDDVFYLVGGHKFMGRYNPMGPDHGPGFSQVYTNDIRKFRLELANSIMVEHLPSIHDELHLRRRDYNLLPILNQGKKELMVYSGVFQNNANLPWLYPVRITSQNYFPIEDFRQRFNHYHCATLPIFNALSDEMHCLFFGGIAQFYPDENMVVQDNDIPFVRTISDVVSSKGHLQELPLVTKMPGYLGSGAELILNQKIPLVVDGIINGDKIGKDFMEIGYIYGGIESTDRNIFWINTGSESVASSAIYKVSIRKKLRTGQTELSVEEATLAIYPDPPKHTIRMRITTETSLPIFVDIFDLDGKKVGETLFESSEIQRGDNMLQFVAEDIEYGTFIYQVRIGDQTINQKVAWSE